jgi:hypothetical protein
MAPVRQAQPVRVLERQRTASDSASGRGRVANRQTLARSQRVPMAWRRLPMAASLRGVVLESSLAVTMNRDAR